MLIELRHWISHWADALKTAPSLQRRVRRIQLHHRAIIAEVIRGKSPGRGARLSEKSLGMLRMTREEANELRRDLAHNPRLLHNLTASEAKFNDSMAKLFHVFDLEQVKKSTAGEIDAMESNLLNLADSEHAEIASLRIADGLTRLFAALGPPPDAMVAQNNPNQLGGSGTQR